MSAVFKKEFSQLFHSMIGYVCLAVFAAITGYYFFTLNLLAASGDVRGYFSSVANVIMLILPMLTMRSFSEEKKMRTDQLLIASPVSSFAICHGESAGHGLLFHRLPVALRSAHALVVSLLQRGFAFDRLLRHRPAADGFRFSFHRFVSERCHRKPGDRLCCHLWRSAGFPGSSAMPAPMFPSIGFGSFCMPLRCSTDTAASPWAFSPFRM